MHTANPINLYEKAINVPYYLHDPEILRFGDNRGGEPWGKVVVLTGEAREPGRYNGMVGTSSKTCCATALVGLGPAPGVTIGSGAFIAPWTRAS
jgi:hypothetical protein